MAIQRDDFAIKASVGGNSCGNQIVVIGADFGIKARDGAIVCAIKSLFQAARGARDLVKNTVSGERLMYVCNNVL